MIYPITLIQDRYNGTYSGAKWLAFNEDTNEIDPSVSGDDESCMKFWETYSGVVGKGDDPDSAIKSLELELSFLSGKYKKSASLRLNSLLKKSINAKTHPPEAPSNDPKQGNMWLEGYQAGVKASIRALGGEVWY